MKDIADIVGVSKATVSYVLNNKSNSRVSETTRKRILHVANLYNYSPSIIAKSLSSSNLANPVGIIIGTDEKDSWLFAQEQTDFIFSIISQLRATEQNIVLLKTTYPIRYPTEALIGINLTSEEITRLSEQVFVPFILLDSLTQDTLFYQFCIDYCHVLKEAKNLYGSDGYSCVFNPYRNKELQRKISKNLSEEDVFFYSGHDEFLKYVHDRHTKGKKLLFFCSALAIMAKDLLLPADYAVVTCDTVVNKYFENNQSFSYSSEITVGRIIDLIQNLIIRKEDKLPLEHLQKISVESIKK